MRKKNVPPHPTPTPPPSATQSEPWVRLVVVIVFRDRFVPHSNITFNGGLLEFPFRANADLGRNWVWEIEEGGERGGGIVSVFNIIVCEVSGRQKAVSRRLRTFFTAS